ncbi:MAG: NAD(P)H-hydrate dehydratase [Bacteroidota bacterium]
MKILSPSQIKEADLFTIKNEPIPSIELMERAAMQCYNWVVKNLYKDKPIDIFCGVGNNGGDGLVISRLLINAGWNIRTYIVEFSGNFSDDFKINYERLKGLTDIIHIKDFNTIPVIDGGYIIDAIFGVGLSKAPVGFTKSLIEKINKSNARVIAIDMPSGLYAQQKTDDTNSIIKADYTLTFQSVKLSLLLPEYAEFSGSFEVLDIGLLKEYIDSTESYYHLLDKSFVSGLWKKRKKFSHKGSYGHSLIVGGSTGKIGAILLTTKAAVKSGSGLVTSLIPKCGYQVLQTAVPEAMVLMEGENHLDSLYYSIKPTAIGIGPGLGTVVGTHELLKSFLEDNRTPMVLDADALNHLSQHREMMDMLPEGAVLTPHPKEFERLVGTWNDDYEKMKLASEFSMNYQVILVLKEAHTSIFMPDGNIYFNSTGNPGLASGGSGDVLTGIITSLIAQGYSNFEACALGVYIHGRTADISLELGEESVESFSAGDIIKNIGKAFIELKNDQTN